MDASPFTAPTTLEGRFVRLEPLTVEHAPALFEASKDPSIWTYLVVPQPISIEAMAAWIGTALCEAEAGRHLPFAAVRLEDAKVVGTTRYLDIRPFDGSVEIGWTWYAKWAQRTYVNTECKLLLLTHAFETLGCTRVQLKTDANNARSRAAIERIGAQFEGVLRNYQRYWHGALRDTAMYAMTDTEWPEIKVRLESKLREGRT